MLRAFSFSLSTARSRDEKLTDFAPLAKSTLSSADSTAPLKEQVQALQVLEADQVTLTLKGHTRAVASVAFSADGKRLASASRDRTVSLRDVTPRP